MNKPHKHAALIKAWADGAEIQYDIGRGWTDYNQREMLSPSWNVPSIDFRIKPKTIKYRLALWLFCEEPIVNCFNDDKYINHPCFIKWISDWQEVEI